MQVSRHSVTRVTRDTKALLGNQTSLGGPSRYLELGMGRRLEAKGKSCLSWHNLSFGDQPRILLNAGRTLLTPFFLFASPSDRWCKVKIACRMTPAHPPEKEMEPEENKFKELVSICRVRSEPGPAADQQPPKLEGRALLPDCTSPAPGSPAQAARRGVSCC